MVYGAKSSKPIKSLTHTTKAYSTRGWYLTENHVSINVMGREFREEEKQSKSARVIPLLVSKKERLRNKGAIEVPHLIRVIRSVDLQRIWSTERLQTINKIGRQ